MQESMLSSASGKGPELPPSPQDLGDVIANRGRWLATVARLVGDRHAANDVLHNACVNALARSESLKDRERFAAWFRRVLVNAAVDYVRRDQAYRRTLNQFALDVASVAQQRDSHGPDCECIPAVLAGLKPAYSTILQMVDVDGQPLEEVARRAGITATNARVRLHRARNAFRARLVVTCGGDPADRCAPCGCEPESGCRRPRRQRDAVADACNADFRRAS